MSMTIPNTTKVKVIQYRPEYATLNSISKYPFYGNIEIEYYPANRLLEFMAFEEWLGTLCSIEFTIESFCDTIFDKITDELGFIPLSVMVNAHTQKHYPVTTVRIRTKEEIRTNPVYKAVAERKVLVAPPGSSVPKSSTKRGKR